MENINVKAAISKEMAATHDVLKRIKKSAGKDDKEAHKNVKEGTKYLSLLRKQLFFMGAAIPEKGKLMILENLIECREKLEESEKLFILRGNSRKN